MFVFTNFDGLDAHREKKKNKVIKISFWFERLINIKWPGYSYCPSLSLRKRCPHSEFFWYVFSRIWTKYGPENLRICILFRQCIPIPYTYIQKCFRSYVLILFVTSKISELTKWFKTKKWIAKQTSK